MRFLLLGLLGVAAASCGGNSDACSTVGTFPVAPATTLTSDSGGLQVEIRTSPQPLIRGADAVQYTITDANHQPSSGLQLQVVPWMPDMGHGSSVVPTVAEQGGGVYLVSCVDLAMPGTWQLRTTFSGPVSDSATPAFQIP